MTGEDVKSRAPKYLLEQGKCKNRNHSYAGMKVKHEIRSVKHLAAGVRTFRLVVPTDQVSTLEALGMPSADVSDLFLTGCCYRTGIACPFGPVGAP